MPNWQEALGKGSQVAALSPVLGRARWCHRSADQMHSTLYWCGSPAGGEEHASGLGKCGEAVSRDWRTFSLERFKKHCGSLAIS